MRNRISGAKQPINHEEEAAEPIVRVDVAVRICRLRAACEKAKRLLSSSVETTIDIDCLFEGIDFSPTINRARFEKLNMDLFTDCMTPVEKCLTDAKMSKSDVDDVVLAGGSTRIPKVQQLLREFFGGKELSKSINPYEAVAYGAAFQAAVLAGIGTNKPSVVVDVAPLSLGICVGKLADEMMVVIPRNTTLPTRIKGDGLTTVHDYQTAAAFLVYEGESPWVKDNNLLGKFTLYNIPPAPHGVPSFDVWFNIDADGILTVTAELRGSDNKDQITITDHSGRLSKEEIDKMVAASEKFRAEDEERQKATKVKNTLECYVNEISCALRGSGRTIGNKDKRKLGDVVEKTIKWLEWNYLLFDANKFEDKLKEVQSICEPIIEKMDRQRAADVEDGYTSPKPEIIDLD